MVGPVAVEVAVGEQCAEFQDGFSAPALRPAVDAFVRQIRYPAAGAP
ncbi:hypothetical protein OG379_01455 [Streptomyces sp. NBC_01166]|nr:hypothetical protein OG379_01455 [Streptomyces sp. NBC_01166]